MSALLLLFAAVCCSAFGITLKTGDDFYPTPASEWHFYEHRPAIIQIWAENQTFLLDKIEFVAIEGRTTKRMNSRFEVTDQTIGGFSGQETFQMPDFTIYHSVHSQSDMIRWKCDVQNQANTEIWLELQWRIPFAFDKEFYFWDGNTYYNDFTKLPFKRELLGHTFPLSTVFDETKGLAVGVCPDSLISYLKSELDKEKILTYSVRFAIPSKEKATIEFVFFTYRPIFGYSDAVYGYQRRFPDAFYPSKDIDPRIVYYGADTIGCARIWPFMQADEATIRQRGQEAFGGYGAWDWGHTPFKRAGDWFGRAEYWDWQMDEKERQKIQQRSEKGMYNLIDIEKFHFDRRTQWNIANYRYNMVIAFYVINWIEENLVKQMGAVAQSYMYMNNWSRMGWITTTSTELHMFPWASAFEKTVRRDFPDLIKDLNLSAFGLDNASNDSPYRGKLDYYLPGWAYDEQGKYISTGIGHRKLIDYVHGLKNDKFKIAMMANAGDPFMVTTALDLHLMEGRSHPVEAIKKYPIIRMLRGHKPIHIHSAAGFFNPALDIDWKKLSPDQIRIFYQAQINKYMIGCLEFGLFPSISHVWGKESVAEMMPMLIDLMLSRGFQVVSGCMGTADLKRVRYGQGLNSAICLMNDSYAKIKSQERIINRYFSDSFLVPFYYDGSELSFESSNDSTTFALEIAPTEIETIEIALGIQSDNKDVIFSGITHSVSSVDRKNYSVLLDSTVDTNAILLLQPRKDYSIKSIVVNGSTVQPGEKIRLKAGKNEITVSSISKVFRATETELLTFPYLESVIVTGSNPTPRLAGTAKMLQDFFVFHSKKELPILEQQQEQKIKIILEPNSPSEIKIIESGTVVKIGGSDDFEVQQNTSMLLRLLLRKKYNWVGDLFGWGARPQSPTYDMLRQAGLKHGQYLPKINITSEEILEKLILKEENLKFESNRPLPTISVPKIDNSILIDGKIDAKEWENAARIERLYPLRETPVREQTQVYLLHDGKNIYVAIRCEESMMEYITGKSISRDSDDIWRTHDHVEIFFSDGKEKQGSGIDYQQVIVDAFGSIWDGLGGDKEWNNQGVIAVHRDQYYWSVEMKVPLDQLKVHNKNIIRANFARFRQIDNSWSTWSPVEGDLTQPLKFGTLEIE